VHLNSERAGSCRHLRFRLVHRLILPYLCAKSPGSHVAQGIRTCSSSLLNASTWVRVPAGSRSAAEHPLEYAKHLFGDALVSLNARFVQFPELGIVGGNFQFWVAGLSQSNS